MDLYRLIVNVPDEHEKLNNTVSPSTGVGLAYLGRQQFSILLYKQFCNGVSQASVGWVDMERYYPRGASFSLFTWI